MRRCMLLVLALVLLVGAAAAEGVEFAEQYGVRWFAEGGQFGLQRADGEVLLPAQFKAVDPFRDDWVDGRALAKVQADKGQGSLIDTEGNFVIGPFGGEVTLGFGGVLVLYTNTSPYGSHLVDAADGRDLGLVVDGVTLLGEDRLLLYGARAKGKTDARLSAVHESGSHYATIVDRGWNVVLTFDGDGFYDMESGLARVQRGRRMGLLREDGTWFTEPVWTMVSQFSDGYALAEDEDGCRFLNGDGEVAFGRVWKAADVFRDGVAFVYDGDMVESGSGTEPLEERWRMIDTDGNTIRENLPRAYTFSCGLAVFEQSGLGGARMGYMGTDGNVAIEPIWRYADDFSEEGLALVRDPETMLYGYIDSTGALAIPCRYERAERFSSGRASVQRDGLCGYLDASGNEVIPLSWAYAYAFDKDGFASVGAGNDGYTIDASGNVLGTNYFYDNSSWW